MPKMLCSLCNGMFFFATDWAVGLGRQWLHLLPARVSNLLRNGRWQQTHPSADTVKIFSLWTPFAREIAALSDWFFELNFTLIRFNERDERSMDAAKSGCSQRTRLKDTEFSWKAGPLCGRRTSPLWFVRPRNVMPSFDEMWSADCRCATWLHFPLGNKSDKCQTSYVVQL